MSFWFFLQVSGKVSLTLYVVLMLAGIISKTVNKGKEFSGQNYYLPLLAKNLTSALGYVVYVWLVVALVQLVCKGVAASNPCYFTKEGDLQFLNMSLWNFFSGMYGGVVLVGVVATLIMLLTQTSTNFLDYAIEGLKTLGRREEKKVSKTNEN